MTHDELWGAVFLALGVFQACRLFSSLDSGKWTYWPYGREPLLTVDRRAHPIGFSFCVAWQALAMTVLVLLGAYEIAPFVLPIFGK